MEIWQKPLKIKINPQADLSNPPRSRTERKGRLARARTQDSPPTDTPEPRGHVGAGGPPRAMCAGRPVRFRPGDGAEAPVRSLAQLCAGCQARASVEEGLRNVTLQPVLDASTERVLPDKGLDGGGGGARQDRPAVRVQGPGGARGA